MSEFKTGEKKVINITMSFAQGDSIDNYSQIVVVLFYCLKKDQKMTIANYAKDTEASGLPAGHTFKSITINGDVLSLELLASETANLDLEEGSQFDLLASIALGDSDEDFQDIKARNDDDEECIWIAKVTRSKTEAWV